MKNNEKFEKKPVKSGSQKAKKRKKAHKQKKKKERKAPPPPKKKTPRSGTSNSFAIGRFHAAALRQLDRIGHRNHVRRPRSPRPPPPPSSAIKLQQSLPFTEFYRVLPSFTGLSKSIQNKPRSFAETELPSFFFSSRIGDPQRVVPNGTEFFCFFCRSIFFFFKHGFT